MKLLLTSGGITNKTLARTLEDMVGKPLTATRIAFIPTAAFAETSDKGWLIDDLWRLRQLGAAIDIVDIAQLAIAQIVARLENSDVIAVGGGNAFYLSYWMQQKGLMELLPDLVEHRVYVGISAGSMMAGAHLHTVSQSLAKGDVSDAELATLGPKARSNAQTLDLVHIAIKAHLNSQFFPKQHGALVQDIANKYGAAVYTIDDQSAVCLTDDSLHVVTEGEYHIYVAK